MIGLAVRRLSLCPVHKIYRGRCTLLTLLTTSRTYPGHLKGRSSEPTNNQPARPFVA